MGAKTSVAFIIVFNVYRFYIIIFYYLLSMFLATCLFRIYQYQQFGYSFSSVEKLLHAMGGDGFLVLANQTLEEAMLGEGFSQSFLNDIVAPFTRVNYGQSVRINGFVGEFYTQKRGVKFFTVYSDCGMSLYCYQIE